LAGCCFNVLHSPRTPKAFISSEISNLRDGRITPEVVFRDPYLMDFLGPKGAFSEHDLENAILREIKGVLLELGTGFAFAKSANSMKSGICRCSLHRRLKSRAAPGLADMTDDANPFIFCDMPDEAVVAIDQFLEAFYNHFQNHYFAQMHRWYYELHEREHSHDPVPWRPLDDPPF
jgi:hypothetical protein